MPPDGRCSRIVAAPSRQVVAYQHHWLGGGGGEQLLESPPPQTNASVVYLRWIGGHDSVEQACSLHCCPPLGEGALLHCPADGVSVSVRGASSLSELHSLAAQHDAALVANDVRGFISGRMMRQGRRLIPRRALPPNALNLMETLEPPAWSELIPTHRADFTSRFDLALSFDGAAAGHVLNPYPVLGELAAVFDPLRLSFEERSEAAPIVALVGNCGTQGSAKRRELLELLMRHVRVDSYGSCLNNRGGTMSRAEEAGGGLRRYKFVVALENSVCPGYVTEKIARGYNHQLVPIVFERKGVPGYAQWYPPHSYVNAADFGSVRALAQHLGEVAASRERWMAYHEHRGRDGGNGSLAQYSRRRVSASGMPLCRLARRAAEWARSGAPRTPLPPMASCLKGRDVWPFEEQPVRQRTEL